MYLIIATILVIVACGALEEVWAVRETKPLVTIAVRPTIMVNRGDIVVTVRVPADEQNSGLVIAWTSDAGSAGTSFKKVDGENGPVLFSMELPSQQPANYVFSATLFDLRSKIRAHAEQRIYTPNPNTDRPASGTPESIQLARR
jgi:hypothetical protein